MGHSVGNCFSLCAALKSNSNVQRPMSNVQCRKKSEETVLADQFIPRTMNGNDDFWIVRVLLDLLTQFYYKIINGPGSGSLIITPNVLKQVVPCHNFVFTLQ